MSTAEAISLLANSMALAGNFGSGSVAAEDVAAGLQGAVVKDEEKDQVVWQEYLKNVMKKRGAAWRDLYKAVLRVSCLMPDRGTVDMARKKATQSRSGWQIQVFGTRHLSPSGAWHLHRFLDRIRPEIVLIEGLSDASGVIPDITRRGSVPPIAILAYTEELPVRTLVYPLARYSPEYQALLWAREHKVAAEFIDLPSDVFLALQDSPDRVPAGDGETEETDESLEGEQAAEQAPGASTGDERGRVSLYQQFAQRSNESDYETYWETAIRAQPERGELPSGVV